MATAEHALQLLQSIYDVVLGRTDWATVIARISNATGGHSGILRLVDYRRSAIGFVAAHGYNDSELAAYRNHFIHLDPYGDVLAKAPTGAICLSDECVPLSVRRHTEYWNDYERPQDRTHALGSPLGREQDFLLYLGLSRGHRAGPYDEASLTLVRSLLPHLLRAVQIQRLAGSAVEARRLSEAALDCLRIGVVLMDLAGGVRFANAAAIELATTFGITLAESGITLPGSRFNDRFQRLIASAVVATSPGARTAGGDLTLSRPGVGLLQLRVFPFLPNDESGLGGQRVQIAVFLVHPGSFRLKASQLATQFGLTAAESRLAVQLTSGNTVAEAAAASGISLATARTHLRAVFAKTGTRRQPELALMLLTSLAGLTGDNYPEVRP